MEAGYSDELLLSIVKEGIKTRLEMLADLPFDANSRKILEDQIESLRAMRDRLKECADD